MSKAPILNSNNMYPVVAELVLVGKGNDVIC